ncbi:allene oxide cyclase barrel-like domain-containing protein [Streptomyces sp. NPDC054956]
MRPIRTACLGATTALVTLLVCAPLATASTADHDATHSNPRKHKVITLTGTLAEQSRFPVNLNGPAAQGDRTVVRSILTDEDGKKVGETGGFCTTTRAALTEDPGGAEECVVTYTLPDGQLTAQGMYFGILKAGPPPSFDNAITGGTGKYRRASGTVHAETIGTGMRRFTIDIEY